MKGFFKEFFLRGLICSGFGPLVLAVIYYFLGLSGAETALLPQKAAAEIVSITLAAFVIAGMTAIYQAEHLPLLSRICIHAVVLYCVYLLLYLVNGWLAAGLVPILVFSGIFFAGFALIWVIIYWVSRKKIRALNQAIKNGRSN